MIQALLAAIVSFFFGFGTAAIMAASKIVSLESKILDLRQKIRESK